jgi:hypothetical protein
MPESNDTADLKEREELLQHRVEKLVLDRVNNQLKTYAAVMGAALVVAGISGWSAIPEKVEKAVNERVEKQALAGLEKEASARLTVIKDHERTTDSIRAVLQRTLAALRPDTALAVFGERLAAELQRNDGCGRSIAGQPGPRGEVGPAGPMGDAGPRGETGPAGNGVLSTEHGDAINLKRNGIIVAQFGAGTQSGALSRWMNYDGKEVAYVGSSSAANGLVLLANRAGQRAIQLDASGLGGSAEFLTATGTRTVFIGPSRAGNGVIEVNGKTVGDYAEFFATDDANAEPGRVVSAHATETVRQSTRAYDTRVIGVVSGAKGLASGMVIGNGAGDRRRVTVALVGQVYVRVCAEGGDIAVGDILVASSRPGTAMRGADLGRAQGATLGKALEPWKAAPNAPTGFVRMLVMLR